MESELLHILQHSLGLDQYGNGRRYRNHFVAGGRDVDLCRQLVAMGYMVEHPASELSGGSPWFSVTKAGIKAVSDFSPAPPPKPKRTKSQNRYDDYIRDDGYKSFADFIGVDTECRRVDGGYQYINRHKKLYGPVFKLKKDAKAGWKAILKK